jgi:DNA sulfur modification protein DndE
MPIEHIHLSQQAKEYLIRLKSKTGIRQWNILCRWAFCLSLAEPTIPPATKIAMDSNVEMTWKVFGGVYHEIYYALIKERCKKDGLEISEEILTDQFRLHLHRGIGYLFANSSVNDISTLLRMINVVELNIFKIMHIILKILVVEKSILYAYYLKNTGCREEVSLCTLSWMYCSENNVFRLWCHRKSDDDCQIIPLEKSPLFVIYNGC